MIPLLIRSPRSLIEALDEQAERLGLTRAVLARALLQQGLGEAGEIAALREVLEFAGRRGLSSERLAAMLEET